MDIMYLLVPISIFLVFLIGYIFWWALNNRQFDALDEVSARILEDSESEIQTYPTEPTGHAKVTSKPPECSKQANQATQSQP